jgi:hypothetical protein
MCKENFFDFIESIFEEGNFTRRALLGFVAEHAPVVSKWRRHWESLWELTDPRQLRWKRSPETASECFERWLDETGIGRRDFLCIEESRPNGQVRFYVIGSDDNDPTEDDSLRKWHEISKGWAYPQEVGDKIKGLIGNKVMREGCTLHVAFEGYRRRYTHRDFIPWKPKD